MLCYGSNGDLSEYLPCPFGEYALEKVVSLISLAYRSSTPLANSIDESGVRSKVNYS
jgi:hypothetical protein